MNLPGLVSLSSPKLLALPYFKTKPGHQPSTADGTAVGVCVFANIPAFAGKGLANRADSVRHLSTIG